MDTRTSQMAEASFRGVTFRVHSESVTEAGRKVVLHEYVNSSERFIEDLGQIPRRFSVSAFVHGNDFIARARDLEAALDKEGSGKLFLPTFGSVTVFALPYVKDANQQSIGEIKFDLEFAVGRPASGPSLSAVDTQQVYSLGDTARQKIQGALADLFVIPAVLENSSVAQFDINASLEGMLANYKEILPSVNLSRIEDKINRVKSALPQLIRSPSVLAANLIGGTPSDAGLWQEISLGLTGGHGLTNLISSTSFGGGSVLGLSDINGDSVAHNLFDSSPDAVPLWNDTTNPRISRNSNRLNIVNSQRVSAMVGAYEVAADTKYNTQIEIINTRAALEDIHERIMRDETINAGVIQSDDLTRRAVENIRLASLAVLEQKEQEAFTLSGFSLNATSSSFVQAYNFYAEEFTQDGPLSDRAILLRRLNPELPAIALNREISIFRTV